MAVGIEIHSKATIKGNEAVKYQIRVNVEEATRSALAKEARRLFDIANKRINRLSAAKDVYSPNLKWVNSNGGKFYTKGLDSNQLIKEMQRCVHFLNGNTSTVKTARAYTKALLSDFSKEFGYKLTLSQVDVVYSVLHEVEKGEPATVQIVGYTPLVQYIADEVNKKDNDSIRDEFGNINLEALIKKAQDEAVRLYEANTEEFDDFFTDAFTF